MTRSARSRVYGFTLIEAVITLALIGALTALIARPIADLIQARSNVGAATEQQANIDYALGRMARDIRFGVQGVEACKEGQFRIENEYRLDGSTLRVNDSVLAEGIETFKCELLAPGELRLYRLVINDSETRVFKRKD